MDDGSRCLLDVINDPTLLRSFLESGSDDSKDTQDDHQQDQLSSSLYNSLSPTSLYNYVLDNSAEGFELDNSKLFNSTAAVNPSSGTNQFYTSLQHFTATTTTTSSAGPFHHIPAPSHPSATSQQATSAVPAPSPPVQTAKSSWPAAPASRNSGVATKKLYLPQSHPLVQHKPAGSIVQLVPSPVNRPPQAIIRPIQPKVPPQILPKPLNSTSPLIKQNPPSGNATSPIMAPTTTQSPQGRPPSQVMLSQAAPPPPSIYAGPQAPIVLNQFNLAVGQSPILIQGMGNLQGVQLALRPQATAQQAADSNAILAALQSQGHTLFATAPSAGKTLGGHPAIVSLSPQQAAQTVMTSTHQSPGLISVRPNLLFAAPRFVNPGQGAIQLQQIQTCQGPITLAIASGQAIAFPSPFATLPATSLVATNQGLISIPHSHHHHHQPFISLASQPPPPKVPTVISTAPTSPTVVKQQPKATLNLAELLKQHGIIPENSPPPSPTPPPLQEHTFKIGSSPEPSFDKLQASQQDPHLRTLVKQEAPSPTTMEVKPLPRHLPVIKDAAANVVVVSKDSGAAMMFVSSAPTMQHHHPTVIQKTGNGLRHWAVPPTIVCRPSTLTTTTTAAASVKPLEVKTVISAVAPTVSAPAIQDPTPAKLPPQHSSKIVQLNVSNSQVQKQITDLLSSATLDEAKRRQILDHFLSKKTSSSPQLVKAAIAVSPQPVITQASKPPPEPTGVNSQGLHLINLLKPPQPPHPTPHFRVVSSGGLSSAAEVVTTASVTTPVPVQTIKPRQVVSVTPNPPRHFVVTTPTAPPPPSPQPPTPSSSLEKRLPNQPILVRLQSMTAAPRPPQVPVVAATPPVVTKAVVCQTHPSSVVTSSSCIIPPKLEEASSTVPYPTQGLKILPPPPPSAKSSAPLRAQRIKNRLYVDQDRVLNPDTRTPFQSKEDACRRLISYHLYDTPLPTQAQIDREEEQFEKTSEHLLARQRLLIAKYKHLMLRNSMKIAPSSEVVMLERSLIQEEETLLHQERQAAAEGKWPADFCGAVKVEPRGVKRSCSEMEEEEEESEEEEGEESAEEGGSLRLVKYLKQQMLLRRQQQEPRVIAVKSEPCELDDMAKLRKELDMSPFEEEEEEEEESEEDTVDFEPPTLTTEFNSPLSNRREDATPPLLTPYDGSHQPDLDFGECWVMKGEAQAAVESILDTQPPELELYHQPSPTANLLTALDYPDLSSSKFPPSTSKASSSYFADLGPYCMQDSEDAFSELDISQDKMLQDAVNSILS